MGYSHFPQALIAMNSHLFTEVYTPDEKWGVELPCGKGSRTRPFELLRKLN